LSGAWALVADSVAAWLLLHSELNRD